MRQRIFERRTRDGLGRLLAEVDRFVTKAEYYRGLKMLRKPISAEAFSTEAAPTPGYRPSVAFEHHR